MGLFDTLKTIWNGGDDNVAVPGDGALSSATPLGLVENLGQKSFPAVPDGFANSGFAGFGNNGWGAWGGGSWSNWGSQAQPYDVVKAAGKAWENSLVFAALDWQATSFQEAPFCVKRILKGGAEEIALGHDLARLMKRPNPFWSRSMFWRITLLSRAVTGNAYWFKVRSAAGRVVELWWMPSSAVRPVAGSNGEYLSHYEYRVGGKVLKYAPSDVVHFRYGVDPNSILLGMSPFRALIRQVATDNEASQYENVVLHNMGVPGMIVSPPDANTEISEDDAAKIKSTIVARTTGSERGKPIVFPIPLKIDIPGISPNDLGLENVHNQVESRICMVLKIPPVVLGAYVGLKTSSAKASYEESERIAWRHNIVPTQEEFTEEIDHQLLPDLGNPDNEYSIFDRSEVVALQEDRDKLHLRTQNDFKFKICDRAEARGKVGYEVREEDRDIWFDGNAAVDPNADPNTPDPNVPNPNAGDKNA